MSFILIWQGYIYFGFFPSSVLPSPTSIINAILTFKEVLFVHTLQTVGEAVLGLLIAIILGVLVAVIIFLFPLIRKAVYPFLVLSQSIPIIALAPLLLLWFGFGLLPKVIIVALYCFFPISIAVSDALLHTDKQFVDLLKGMKASSWQILIYIRIPAALPAFFSGLRIAVTYAIAGAIVGEYVGAYQGLGIFMQTAARNHATTLVFASLFAATFISVLFFITVSLVEKIMIPWRIKND